jgi:hypothetical protein
LGNEASAGVEGMPDMLAMPEVPATAGGLAMLGVVDGEIGGRG